MRPSELLRRCYPNRDDPNLVDNCPIFMVFSHYEESHRKDGGRFAHYKTEIVPESVNTIIAKACYMERLTAPKHSSEHEEYERTSIGSDPFRNLYSTQIGDSHHYTAKDWGEFSRRIYPRYSPHQAVPLAWCIEGGV